MSGTGWGLTDTTITFEDLYPGTDAQVLLRDPRSVTKADQQGMITAVTYTLDEQGKLKASGIKADKAVEAGCRVAAGLIRSWVMYDRDGNALELPDSLDERARLLMECIPENVTEKILKFIRDKSGQGTVPKTASAS